MSNDKKPGVYRDEDGNLTQNQYTKRSAVESDAFLRNMGLIVVTEAGDQVRVPRWSIKLTEKLGRAMSRIINKLYPHGDLFLNQALDMADDEASSYVYKTLFVECIEEFKQIIFITLRIDDDREACEQLESSTTFPDLLHIIDAIVEQEIQNPMLIAMVKKTITEVTTKLQLATSSTPSAPRTPGR